jgi:hypothetical protein
VTLDQLDPLDPKVSLDQLDRKAQQVLTAPKETLVIKVTKVTLEHKALQGP